jgi:hypothetical protein
MLCFALAQLCQGNVSIKLQFDNWFTWIHVQVEAGIIRIQCLYGATVQFIVCSQFCTGLEHGSRGIATVNIHYQETSSENTAEE